MEKFKCEYSDGCSYSTTINNKELVDLTESEIDTILKPILFWFIDNSRDEGSRREDYAQFMQETDDFFNLIENASDAEMDIIYEETYEKFKSEYTLDKLKRAVDTFDDFSSLQMLFEEFLREFGVYEDFGYCEQCGSYNSYYSYTIEI